MNKKNIFLYSVLTLAISGCAVSHKDVTEMRDTRMDVGNENIRASAKVQKQESSLTRISGNFIGDQPIDMPASATLPPIFFEKVSLHSNGVGFGTVSQASKNLSLATGVAIYVNPDVEYAQPIINQAQQPGTPPPAPNAQAGQIPGPNPQINLNAPINSNPMGVAFGTGAPGSTLNPVSNRNLVKLDYQGTMLGYIKYISNSAGIEWEFRDNALTFRRMVTKVFTLTSVSPGDVEVADNMSKGGRSQTGQQGGQNAAATGNFESTSTVGMKGNYSVWKLLRPALESALTLSGKMSINEGSGTITVTDTKDAVLRVEKIIERENNILGRQVAIDVRIIRVSVNDQTQAGINLNAVYSLFDQAGAIVSKAALSAPSTQTTASAGSMTFAVTDPLSRWNATSVAIQGLNQFGNVVTDSSSQVITTNRVPAMTGTYSTQGFLAQTTPAAGGAVAGGTGVPGLTPGSATTGSFMRVLPTIRDNNTVLLNMSVDVSDLLGFGSASTGTGSTFQQIQWANTDGTKTTSNIVLNQGESMVMVGIGADGVNGTVANGVGGVSTNATKKKALFVVVVTPRIMKGL